MGGIIQFGNVTPFAGTQYEDNFGYKGWVDGPGDMARFNAPWGLCVDASHNVFVADTFNHRIRKVTPEGMVSTIAGNGDLGGFDYAGGFADGPALQAMFRFPRGIAVDASGSLYVADTGNYRIRKISEDGMVSTVAITATPSAQASSNGVDGPSSVAVEANGGLVFTDGEGLRQLTPGGEMISLAANQRTGRSAYWTRFTGVAVAKDGTIFGSDGNRILRIDQQLGTTSVLAGHLPVCP